MASISDKENIAPLVSSDLPRHTLSPPKASKKGRSKSIGPGDLVSSDGPKHDIKQDAKNRRKSAFVPATKAIISADAQKAERQAARRRTLANRRVSFAPEATLHTWDVIEFMRDPTTSTDASDQTRRTSNITRSPHSSSPAKHSSAMSSDDAEPPSTPPGQEDEPTRLMDEPAHQRDLHEKQRHRSAGASSMDFNNPDDAASSSGVSGSSDVSGSEDEEEEDEDLEDATGTAMSLDAGDDTIRSSESESSTSSSVRLEAALRQAANQAGTRGIEFDEYGEEDAPMELAGDTVTNAFKPWALRGTVEAGGSAALDQENINPFSPAFKAQIVSGTVIRHGRVEEEDTGDLSMDVTRAVGGIVRAQARETLSSPLGDGTMDVTRAVGGILKPQLLVPASSPLGDETMDVTRAVGGILRSQAQKVPSSPIGDGTMDFTQAVSKIHPGTHALPTTRSDQKRRRSTTEAGSPGVTASGSQHKRRRSSVARSSMGDDTMDLTLAIGGIQKPSSPTKKERRKSVARRRSSGVVSEQDEATMEFTQAVGGIKAAARMEHTTSSIDENEELTMELTTVLGGIRAAEHLASEERPFTPVTSQSPVRKAANTTPKDQERFMNAPDSGPRKLLTPIFHKQVGRSAEKSLSAGKRRKTISPAPISWMGAVFDDGRGQEERSNKPAQPSYAINMTSTSSVSPPKVTTSRSKSPLTERQAFVPQQSPMKTPLNGNKATPDTQLKLQLDEQLQDRELSPTLKKVLRSSPARSAVTPELTSSTQDVKPTMIDSIKLMSTPRKETLKALTPKKHTAPRHVSPLKTMTPRPRPTPKGRANMQVSSARPLSDDLTNLQASSKPIEKVHLQSFLEQAGIRFMDLTTTKRRLTVAPTPSKARRNGESDVSLQESEAAINLENAVVSAACTQPEHDMYQHACHELKHYISEGKKVIKQLEAETYRNTPPLIQAYGNATSDRKAVLDAQMRDMKTHARLRSKEMWYAWRSQLLEDLMKALSGIGEGLLKDDEVLQQAEEAIDNVLPSLLEEESVLRQEFEELEEAAAVSSEGEKNGLEAARARLVEVDEELEEKQRLLKQLTHDLAEQECLATDMQEGKAEFTAAIREAERVREACRGISLNEIASLKETIANLEATHGWSITSASSSPPTVTMTYKTQLQLFFHPAAFLTPSHATAKARPNAAISLQYIALDRNQNPKGLTTTLRFFLQLLRASLQALSQSSTRVSQLLSLVSNGWETALATQEAERRLNLETLTASRIVSDERLAIEATILLPHVRTKVRVAFELLAAVGGEQLAISTSMEVRVWVVYGEQYSEENMTKFVRDRAATEGWAGSVRKVREKLVATGKKGFRK